MVQQNRTTPFVIRDLEALRVVSDPLRVRLLAACGKSPSSVKEMGADVGIPAGKLYYHVELLERHGLLVVDSTRVVSGIIEKRYRTVSPDIRVDRGLLGAQSPEETLDVLLGAVLDGTRIEAERSARAGVLAIQDEADPVRSGLFARKQIRLSPRRAAELRARLADLLDDCVDGSDASDSYGLTFAFFPIAPGE